MIKQNKRVPEFLRNVQVDETIPLENNTTNEMEPIPYRVSTNYSESQMKSAVVSSKLNVTIEEEQHSYT